MNNRTAGSPATSRGLRDRARLDHRQWFQPPDHLSIDGERFSAGSDHDDIRAAPSQLLGETGCRFEHLLTVVQHNQSGLVREVVQHYLLEAASPHLRKVQDRRHSAGDASPVRGGGELDQPGTVVEVVHDVKGDLHRKAGFANPSSSDDRHESGLTDQRGQRGPLLGTADEAGPVEWQVVMDHPLDSQRWEVGWKLWVEHLEEASRRREPAQLEEAQRGQAHIGWESCPHGGRGRLGEQDLAAVRPSTDPCRLMQAK